ncbi:MAG: penicillin-binding protein 2 [Chloroflexi bacterium]|nr:penicillin-binding protein 2 [Chloroflexota bacterium]
MIATNVRRLGVYLMLAFAVVSASAVWWQVIEAHSLSIRTDNPEVIAARRSLPRGTIFDASGQVLASSEVIDGLSRRTYTDPAFTHVLGYSSLRFGTTGIERAFEDILVGQTDPNPIRDLIGDVLDRQPQPRDLTLTIDRRLQDFAAAQLGGDAGAVVAIDPQTGAILALVSAPTFDATPISGDPNGAQEPMDALRNDPAEPLLARARQGLYVPGSIMKVFTAATALDAGAITPDTTYENQPREEREGFVVDGFAIREHDLGGIQPALWPLSPALQVSSNIFFAHVGLDIGADTFLDYARRFGFCAPMRIGPPDRGLSVAASYVTEPVDGDCGPFRDNVELASASFGQGRTAVTPVQMAMLAAAIAGDGVAPNPYVVRDVRSHSEDGSPTDQVLETFGSGGGTRVVSSATAAATRAAMVDAVNGELGRLYAGQADVTLYGIGDARSAGKTGTAELGGEQAPHSWFIGFAPAEQDATPRIAIAVLLERGGSGSAGAAPIAGRIMAEWLRLSAGS